MEASQGKHQNAGDSRRDMVVSSDHDYVRRIHHFVLSRNCIEASERLNVHSVGALSAVVAEFVMGGSGGSSAPGSVFVDPRCKD
jgi:hypothetical protein